ncbi:META domain-containing protein [Pseudonocardia humida]|uniref:META domain-containing protein n=1 Tax=Pseudonocardia humida TaxID=2800819 RepID=A0ABT1A213_9PSEU|nr:META domain-containing protein [Pseudonocardia humida]MCO1656924.1 hypothetical protein [Pseudonocardia humida]
MPRLPLLILLAALTLPAGCAGAAPALTVAAARTPTGAPVDATDTDPAALPGRWLLEGTDHRVLIDPRAIEVREGVRTLTGTWRADPTGRFLARIGAAGGSAHIDPADPTPRWLAAAAGFRVDGDARVLLDRSGAPVARLLPDRSATRPLPQPADMVDPDREPDPAERRRTAPAAPVPAPLVPLTAPELLGHWFPRGATSPAFLTFEEAGTWTGSDGCNAADGSWLVGADGGFLATAPQLRTLIGCEGNVDVATQVELARRVALDGPDLVLLDADGAPLGRYYRASAAGTGPIDPPTGG